MKKYNQTEVIKMLERHIFDAHSNRQKKYAESMKVSDAYVSAVMTGAREPSKKMLSHIGMVKVKPDPFWIKES